MERREALQCGMRGVNRETSRWVPSLISLVDNGLSYCPTHVDFQWGDVRSVQESQLQNKLRGQSNKMQQSYSRRAASFTCKQSKFLNNCSGELKLLLVRYDRTLNQPLCFPKPKLVCYESVFFLREINNEARVHDMLRYFILY